MLDSRSGGYAGQDSRHLDCTGRIGVLALRWTIIKEQYPPKCVEPSSSSTTATLIAPRRPTATTSMSSAHGQTAKTDPPDSSLSRRSSTTLHDNEEQKPEQPYVRQQYVYVDKIKAPNPDAQPKKKSKLSSFLSKFQNPAVRQSEAVRENRRLEEERTGVRTVQVTDVSRSTNAWAAGSLGPGPGHG